MPGNEPPKGSQWPLYAALLAAAVFGAYHLVGHIGHVRDTTQNPPSISHRTVAPQTATASPSPSPSATASPSPSATASVINQQTGAVPALSLDPPQGMSGSQVTVTGSGFEPGENVTVAFDTCHGNVVTTASSTGTFALNVQMSTSLYWCAVAAEGDSSRLSAQKTFTLLGNGGLPGSQGGSSGTSLSLDPPQGMSGSQVTVTGSGFEPGENVTVAFDTCHGNVVTTASSTGTFALNVQMSTNLYRCAVAAEGDSSYRWAQTTFTLEGN